MACVTMSTTTQHTIQSQGDININIKVCDVYKGDAYIWCFGTYMMPRKHLQNFQTTVILILLTYAAFVVCIAPFMQSALAIYVYTVLGTTDLTFLLLTSFTEPGIVPRLSTRGIREKLLADIKRNSMTGNFCMTCLVVKHKDIKHCRHCNTCVDHFDHHCIFVGNCIGVRNYQYFIVFISAITLTASFSFLCVLSLAYGWIRGSETDLYIFRALSIVLFGAWTLLVGILVGALLCFHIFLIARNQTTVNYLRGTADTKDLWGICYSAPSTQLKPLWKDASMTYQEYENEVAKIGAFLANLSKN